MKALGMTVIVYGHVTRAVSVTAPIYPKQLGVAFFLFAGGFTLARDRRPVSQALFTRLFQTWLFAVVLAGGIAAAGAINGTGLALSNFLALVGANVVFDNFPANPTTWYLGTYLHLVIVWAIWLRRIRVRRWMVIAALALEIPIRAALMATAGRFVAYMLLTNWMAVFLLGLAQGADDDEDPARGALPYVVGGAAAGRSARGLGRRLGALSAADDGRLRSDAPRRGARAGAVHRAQYADHLPRAHAVVSGAAPAAGGLAGRLRVARRRAVAGLPGRPGRGLRSDSMAPRPVGCIFEPGPVPLA
jgi:Acyltransferase family